MTHLEKVQAELRRYEHTLMDFSAREHNGTVELVIELKNRDLRLHTYYAPIHARDIEHSQFPWTLGWQPDYITEGKIYAKYILQNASSAKIGIL